MKKIMFILLIPALIGCSKGFSLGASFTNDDGKTYAGSFSMNKLETQRQQTPVLVDDSGDEHFLVQKEDIEKAVSNSNEQDRKIALLKEEIKNSLEKKENPVMSASALSRMPQKPSRKPAKTSTVKEENNSPVFVMFKKSISN